jgi:hypothetical protein
MDKIHPGLAAKLAANPNAKIKVLITISANVHPDQLELPGYNRVMDHILSANVSREKILSLAAKSEVQSIEADEEMEAF